MRRIGNSWLWLRMLVAAFNIYAVVIYPGNETNIDWPACVLIATVCSFAVFCWLCMVARKPAMDWSEPYSLDTPFFPMWRYPARFWFQASLCLVGSGSARLAVDLVRHRDHMALGGTFFFWGLGTFLALQMQRKVRKGAK